MDEIDLIKNRMKKKRRLGKSLKSNLKLNDNPKMYNFLVKLLILLIIFLALLIFLKKSPSNKMMLYEKVFNKHLSFAKINNFYQKHLGGILPFKNFLVPHKTVFKEGLVFKEENIYKDGVCLTVEDNYLVPVLKNGIIIFIGDKEDYGSTVIIQQIDGVDLWYGNLQNINGKIYDYVEEGDFLGEVVANELYLVYKKEGQVINYQDYLN